MSDGLIHSYEDARHDNTVQRPLVGDPSLFVLVAISPANPHDNFSQTTHAKEGVDAVAAKVLRRCVCRFAMKL